MNQQHSLWQRYRPSKKAHFVGLLTMLFLLTGIVPLSAPHIVGASAQASNPIKHIVIMVKENRTFDSMFGTFPGADGATTYTDPKGKVHKLNHQPDHIVFDIDHLHAAYLTAYDHGKMDGFSKLLGAIQNINGKKVDEADSQFYQSDIPNYWQYAQTFALPDHFFYPIQGPSFPNHLLTIAATDDDVISNPYGLGVGLK